MPGGGPGSRWSAPRWTNDLEAGPPPGARWKGPGTVLRLWMRGPVCSSCPGRQARGCVHRLDDEPDGPRLSREDGYCLARDLGLHRGFDADQVGAGTESQLVAAVLIRGRDGHNIVLAQRFDGGSGHRQG